jgi:N-acetyl-gamma-glutamyl-phosphate reductase
MRFGLICQPLRKPIAMAVLGGRANDAELAEVTRQRRLSDLPTTRFERLAELLLTPDRRPFDQLEDRRLSFLFVRHRTPRRTAQHSRDGLAAKAGIDVWCVHYYAFVVHKIPVGVLGASGYAGRELCALVLRHPRLQLAFATANEQRGTRMRIGGRDVELMATEDAPLGDAALVFSALPHGASREWVEQIRAAGARAVDLSSDLRPGNGCDGIPYGLPELLRERLMGAELVANPGCYPTAILLALAPLLEAGLVAPEEAITVAAASGVTGAGNSPRRELLFAEVADDYRAYGTGNVHRHLNEMRAMLSAMGADADLVFTPHLLPVARGILASITVPLATPMVDPLSLWRDRYVDEPFVELASEPPALRDVVHRNVVRISAQPLAHTRRPMLLVLAAIDNLVKGAAGQAVQNANLMLGLEETEGLPA